MELYEALKSAFPVPSKDGRGNRGIVQHGGPPYPPTTTNSVRLSQAQPSQSLLKFGLEQRYKPGVSSDSCLARTAPRMGTNVPASVNRRVASFMVYSRLGLTRISYTSGITGDRVG